MKKLIVLIYIAAATILFGYAKAEVVHQPATASIITNTPGNFEDISVKLINNKAEITWTTAKELKNKQFEVQRSEGEAEFKTIAIFFTLDDSYELKNYKFKDELKGVTGKRLSYRVKQIDMNENIAFSKIVEITI
ncbi:MAG: hypothetical protein QM802_10615 [Agriterribacter sp.]